MQRDSVFGPINNEDNLSQERKTLKVILRLIFRKGSKHLSRDYAPCIRMSDLTDEFATKPKWTISEEKPKMNNKCGKDNAKSDVLNINLDKTPTRSKEVKNGKPKTKTIKVKITISEEDDCQEEHIKEELNDISPDKKEVNDKFCFVEQHNNSFSVVLKMPQKTEKTDCDNTPQKGNVSLNENNELFNSQDKVITEIFLNAERRNYLTDDIMVQNIITKYQSEGKNTIKAEISKFLVHERQSSQIWNIKLDNKTSNKLELSSEIKIKKDLLSQRQPKLENEKFQFTSNTKQNTLFTIQNRESVFHTRNEISIKDASKNFIAFEKGHTNISRAKSEGRYSQGYLTNSDVSLENNRDSNIIHDIIMEHYQDVLNYFTKKRATRDIYKSITSMEENKELADDRDQPPVSYFYEDINENIETKNSLESGLYDMDFSRTMNTFDSSDKKEEEMVEYDSREFLNAALGEDLMSVTTVSQVNLNNSSPLATSLYTAKYGTEKSVGSSEISTLISTTYNKSDIYSLYSTVKKTKKKSVKSKRGPAVRTLFSSVSSNYNYYESVDKFGMDTKSDELARDISLLQGIITQASNAITTCKCSPKLYGSVCHLEAERILLHATYKMDLLNAELNKYEYEEVEQRKSLGTITIYSLKFSNNASIKTEKNNYVTRYYLCIVHSGMTVIASNITSADQNGEIIFNDSMEFIYDSLLSEVDIKISIYSLSMRNKWTKVKCFPTQKIYSPKKRREINDSTSELSYVQLLGSSRIGITELSYDNKFRLNNVPIESTMSDTFDANIVVTLRLNNKFSGFLNINSGHTLWNRRWCVLDGFLLKYWSCPSQENEVKPLRILDLQKCITEKVATVDRSICSRPKTFLLELKSKDMLSPERYLLSADSLPEFSQWTRQIDMTLVMLKDWNKLKCQTVLLNN